MKRNGRLQSIGVLAGLALVSGVVLQVSSAAFTGTTENAGNSWDAGTVTLTDNDNGSALFSVTGLAPADTDNDCIEVTYTGSIVPGSAVTMYGAVTEVISGDGVGDGLGDDLDIVVELGTELGGCTAFVSSSTLYTGTLAAFNTSGSALSTTWTPDASGDMRPFKITYTLGSDTDNDAQGDGADATFTWSATS